MEFFTKSSTVILRSHTEKHLSASSDHFTIQQSRHPTRYAFWRVEPVQNNPTLIRLKNHQTQKYLTASTSPYLLGGMSGKRVIQSFPHSPSPSTHWKPVRDGFQIKLCSADGTFLRANSGSSPWRNSVTHDNKGGSICGGMMKGWLLWDVVKVEIGEEEEVREYLSSFSSFGSSLLDDDDDRSESCSPMSVISYESPRPSSCFRQVRAYVHWNWYCF